MGLSRGWEVRAGRAEAGPGHFPVEHRRKGNAPELLAVLPLAPYWLLMVFMILSPTVRPSWSAEAPSPDLTRYAAALASGAAVFSFEKSGLEAGAQFFGAETDAAFSRDYDAVRILGLAQRNLGKRVSNAEIAGLFRAVRKREADLMEAFFQGALANYIIAAAKGPTADARVLVELAARIDPELQQMMTFLADSQAKLKTWTRQEVQEAMRRIVEMNEKVVIPRDHFLRVATRSAGKNAYFYLACYKVTGRGQATVEGRPVEMIFVTELRTMSVVSVVAGFRMLGSRQVVIDEGALRKRAKELKSRGVSGTEMEICSKLRQGVIAHELGHDIRAAYNGEGGLFDGVRARMDSRGRAVVASETFSMLAALFRGDAALEMHLLKEHATRGPLNSPYSIGAKWIFKQLAKNQPPGAFRKEPRPLGEYSPAELLTAMAKTIEQNWGKAGLAAVKGLDFPPAVGRGKGK